MVSFVYTLFWKLLFGYIIVFVVIPGIVLGLLAGRITDEPLLRMVGGGLVEIVPDQFFKPEWKAAWRGFFGLTEGGELPGYQPDGACGLGEKAVSQGDLFVKMGVEQGRLPIGVDEPSTRISGEDFPGIRQIGPQSYCLPDIVTPVIVGTSNDGALTYSYECPDISKAFGAGHFAYLRPVTGYPLPDYDFIDEPMQTVDWVCVVEPIKRGMPVAYLRPLLPGREKEDRDSDRVPPLSRELQASDPEGLYPATSPAFRDWMAKGGYQYDQVWPAFVAAEDTAGWSCDYGGKAAFLKMAQTGSSTPFCWHRGELRALLAQKVGMSCGRCYVPLISQEAFSTAITAAMNDIGVTSFAGFDQIIDFPWVDFAALDEVWTPDDVRAIDQRYYDISVDMYNNGHGALKRLLSLIEDGFSNPDEFNDNPVWPLYLQTEDGASWSCHEGDSPALLVTPAADVAFEACYGVRLSKVQSLVTCTKYRELGLPLPYGMTACDIPLVGPNDYERLTGRSLSQLRVLPR